MKNKIFKLLSPLKNVQTILLIIIALSIFKIAFWGIDTHSSGRINANVDGYINASIDGSINSTVDGSIDATIERGKFY